MITRTVGFVMLIMVLLVLAACGTAKNYSTTAMLKAQPSTPPQEYLIQPGDQLDIKFFYNPELNEQIIVRPDGRISLQLVNELKAAGVTPGQLSDQLRKAYGTELKKPEVAVIVRTFNDQRVYVDGEVNKPGLVPLPGPMTVLQSISQAGGMKESAQSGEVIVIRKNGEAKPMTIVVNLDEAVDGTDLQQDIPLKPHDIVYVPRSTISNINVWVDQYIRRMVPIPIGLGYGID